MAIFRATELLSEQREEGDVCGPARTFWLSDTGGLTQFGALIEILEPGARSALKHWHQAEDELVYVLEGDVTVVEGNVETTLHAGDGATFRAGDAVGHCVINKSQRPTKCLVVGTRATVDTIAYPDHLRLCQRDRLLDDDVWTDLDGNPASNPYAESDKQSVLPGHPSQRPKY